MRNLPMEDNGLEPAPPKPVFLLPDQLREAEVVPIGDHSAEARKRLGAFRTLLEIGGLSPEQIELISQSLTASRLALAIQTCPHTDRTM